MIVIGIVIGGLIGFYIGHVAGRARGFGECWNQYMKDKWDKMERSF